MFLAFHGPHTVFSLLSLLLVTTVSNPHLDDSPPQESSINIVSWTLLVQLPCSSQHIGPLTEAVKHVALKIIVEHHFGKIHHSPPQGGQ